MIQSERLIFRKIEENDAPIIAEIMRDEGVQKIWEHYFTDEDVKEWIKRRQMGYQNNGIDYLLAVDKTTNEAVGQIGLLKETIEGEDVWGIGYILLSRFCGNGYATEGAKAMADYAFDVLKVSKIVCDIRPMNTASIAVAKRIGMIETGSFVKIYKGMEMIHLIFELQNTAAIIEQAEQINILGDFCGKRDIPDLTQRSLEQAYGIKKADVFVLFGGSILEGGNVLAEAIKEQIADTYIIVGGAGHTTETLRKIAQQSLKEIEIKNLTEAEIFNRYIKEIYGVQADYLECESTNCGNNITLLLELIQANNIKCNSIILAQDATMQYRMMATLKKYVSEELLIINYATYQVRVIDADNNLIFQKQPLGMWNMERYITLLMGEIPRLRDDENGYGPKGKNFISHVDIPDKVNRAFEELKTIFSGSVREANPLYASKG